MIVLGINSSHCATACVLIDGKIVACISEERLTRVKNQSGLPVNAIKEVLKEAKLKTRDIDSVAFSFEDMAINTGYSVLDAGANDSGQLSNPIFPLVWKIKEWMLATIPSSRNIYIYFQDIFYRNYMFPKMREELLSSFEKTTKISKEKVMFVDHHTAHAYTAYYGSPEYWKDKKLILTLDAMGDGVCATVSIGENEKVERLATTSFGNSIGDLYAYVTRYLGMKMGEHEYKVMGLAPYASQKYVDKVYQKIKDWIWVNEKNLTFSTVVFSHVFYKLLDKPFKNERFDNISGAIQKLTEEVITKWVNAAIKKTGVKDIVAAGGVFMNVKANQKIVDLPQVKSLFIFPSCGDESTSIGAAYFTYQKMRGKNNKLPRIQPIKDLYLGSEFGEIEIGKELAKRKYKKYKVEKHKDMEKVIARMISERKIVARFAGRMEWGARALGNRSILTHPQNLEGVRDINEQIKSRDFWMPFAPSVLSEFMNNYVINPKKVDGSYMILAYDTTKLGAEKLRAAIHQYDFSARPQEVKKDFNLGYHKLISEFERLTGIGAVLNTSFNLHGYPIVCTPQDALFVFENSGLQHLALENYLVSKK